jgi:hypothetical protein
MKKMMLLAVLTSTPGFAKSVQCNAVQTRCVADGIHFTIGDRVGFFNTDDELVARGEVIAMRGDRRAVDIEKRFGQIGSDDRMALLHNGPRTFTASRAPGAFDTYKAPSELVVGASLGVAALNIGGGVTGQETSGFAQFHQMGGFKLVGRGSYLAGTGEAHKTLEDGYENALVQVRGLSLWGGAAYVVREAKTVAFRGEADVGVMNAAVTADGDTAAIDQGEVDANIRSGNHFGAKLMLGTVITYESWHGHLDVAQTMVAGLRPMSLSIGLSKDLK